MKETLTVENEPQGLTCTIGFNKRLVYSDSQNGVVEIGQNIINEKGIEKAINVGKTLASFSIKRVIISGVYITHHLESIWFAQLHTTVESTKMPQF